ncbi:hypothetical protein [Brevibacterium album]|uniref:hypothetical protein n=1 Tax=Brevibacterium album TaxID=417948 RepID=UPI00041D1D04|nr:hypothetical protein [Brevibacterium album]
MDKRYHIYWSDDDRAISGSCCNVPEHQLPDALASAFRWAYGDELMHELPLDSWEANAELVVEALEVRDIASYGRIQVAESPEDFWVN